MDCNCPAPTALTAITTENCGVNLKQIQRMAFQRPNGGFNATDVTDIKLLADWQAKIAAIDDEKIVVTPLIGGDPIIEPGEAITEGGGDNTTLNGVAEVEGTNPSKFSCKFNSLSSTVESEMKEIICEKNLVVYLFIQGGLIACVEVVAVTDHDGFPIQAPFVSDRRNEGFGTKDSVDLMFELASGWSNNLVIITPTDFNPLTDL